MDDCLRRCGIGTVNKGRGRMIHGRKIPYQGERIVSDLEVQRRLVWLPEASATAAHSRHTEVELHTSSSESEPSC